MAEATIRIVCGNCLRAVQAPVSLTGRLVKCPDCQAPIRVEQEELAPEPPAFTPPAAPPALAVAPSSRVASPVESRATIVRRVAYEVVFPQYELHFGKKLMHAFQWAVAVALFMVVVVITWYALWILLALFARAGIGIPEYFFMRR